MDVKCSHILKWRRTWNTEHSPLRRNTMQEIEAAAEFPAVVSVTLLVGVGLTTDAAPKPRAGKPVSLFGHVMM